MRKFWLWWLIFILLYLQYLLWFSPNGFISIIQLENLIAEQRERNKRLSECNNLLRDEIRYLRRSREALEERARYELDMIKPGEIYIQTGDEEEISHRHAEIQKKCGLNL